MPAPLPQIYALHIVESCAYTIFSMAKHHRKKEREVRLSTFIIIVLAVAVISVLGTLLVFRIYTSSTHDTREGQQAQTNSQPASAPGPQEFIGVLPCADCSGILTDLTLQKNSDDPSEGTFFLKQT